MFFDGSNVSDEVLFASLKPGKYKVMLRECEVRSSKNDADILYYALKFEVIEGDAKGATHFVNFMKQHPKAIAVELGMARMKNLVVSLTGGANAQSPADLIGKVCLMHLKKSKGELEVDKFEPAQGATTSW